VNRAPGQNSKGRGDTLPFAKKWATPLTFRLKPYKVKKNHQKGPKTKKREEKREKLLTIAQNSAKWIV
jgi:hypothetical protein